MKISKLLINWYRDFGRPLPWRLSKNPYEIWVSEIILQQTRIAQGTKYYLSFIKAFPTIKSLAEADETEVLKLWEGLGYYSRARNLHASARFILSEFDGVFPSNYKDIHSLKGIGSYTAGAIASIVFNLPYPAIDGNVKRVISRIYRIRENINSSSGIKQIESILFEILDKKEPGIFNQALMDLGSMICTPKNPSCSSCILKTMCKAYKDDLVNELPYSYKKIKIRKRVFIYFIFYQEDSILIRKRNTEDIWKGLYEFPLIEYTSMPKKDKWKKELINIFYLDDESIEVSKISPIHKHILSHQKIEARFIHVNIKNLEEIAKNYKLDSIAVKNLKHLPFPRLTEKYILDHLNEYA